MKKTEVGSVRCAGCGVKGAEVNGNVLNCGGCRMKADEIKKLVRDDSEYRVSVDLLLQKIAEKAQKSPWQNPTLNEIRQMIKKALED